MILKLIYIRIILSLSFDYDMKPFLLYHLISAQLYENHNILMLELHVVKYLMKFWVSW